MMHTGRPFYSRCYRVRCDGRVSNVERLQLYRVVSVRYQQEGVSVYVYSVSSALRLLDLLGGIFKLEQRKLEDYPARNGGNWNV